MILTWAMLSGSGGGDESQGSESIDLRLPAGTTKWSVDTKRDQLRLRNWMRDPEYFADAALVAGLREAGVLGDNSRSLPLGGNGAEVTARLLLVLQVEQHIEVEAMRAADDEN